MRVGIDGRYAEGKLVGIGKYVKYLALALSDFGVACVIFYSRVPETRIQKKGIKSVVLKSRNRYFFEQILLPKALKEEGIDIYHAAGNLGVPVFSPVPTILTVHDIIPLRIKDYFAHSNIPFLSQWSFLFRLKTSLARAKKIITISNFVKRQLINSFKLPSNRIKVIKSGVLKESWGGKLPPQLVGQKFILNHGGIDVRKNLDRLIKAFAVVHKSFPDLKLVITGENRFLEPKLKSLAGELKIKNSVVFTGYVDDKTLWALIKSSRCICYPTLMEGFGLPVLEGFSAGVPVISSKITSIPEISGDAALLANPKKEKEVVAAIKKVLSDSSLSSTMIKRGLEEAKKYSWEKTALKTLEVYKDVLI